jgi:hypothetical protein
MQDDHCGDDGQCRNGQCFNCDDEVKNGSETDEDCGGPDCNKCDEGKQCKVNADCKKGVCAAGICNKNGVVRIPGEVL